MRCIVLLLLTLSIIAAYLVIDHLLTIRRNEIMPEGLGEHVRQLLLHGHLTEADQACRAKPSFLSFVLLNGLAEVEGGWPAVEKAMEDATAEQSARLFRKIEYLSVIGNIAPMVGLLGTVTGMIFAFQRVAVTQGSAGRPIWPKASTRHWSRRLAVCWSQSHRWGHLPSSATEWTNSSRKRPTWHNTLSHR